MSDKKIVWSKEARKKIWKDYANNKVQSLYKKEYLGRFELSFEVPCPKCGKKMLKAQYQSFQPDHKHSWNINHIDKNLNNNNLSNLQPMHSRCNQEKG